MIRVTAPSRLHFGLFSFGQPSRRQFGGIGAMLQRPQITVEFRPAGRFAAEGPLADRVSEYVHRWVEYHRRAAAPNCLCRVTAAPRLHIGLGVGTQLGLAVARGLDELCGVPGGKPEVLAGSVGRGNRSAVGTYGFQHGGLIVERGKLEGESLSKLSARVALPGSWRFVLVTPAVPAGLSGPSEQQAFQELRPVPAKVSDELERVAVDEIIPAARNSQFPEFAECVYQYGRLAGSCFEDIQGGPYNGPLLEQLVTQLRSAGFGGVGQSSWGPTLFVVTSSQQEAVELSERLNGWPELSGANIVITRANNRGVRVERSARDCTSSQQRTQ